MAKYTNSPFGTISGRVGDVVAYSSGGVNIIRAYNPKRKDNPSERMREQRIEFATTSRIAGALNPITQLAAKAWGVAPNGFMAVREQVAERAKGLGGVHPDISTITITKGDISPLKFKSVTNDKNGKVTIAWSGLPNAQVGTNKPTDFLRLFVYQPAGFTLYECQEMPKRETGEATIAIPDNFDTNGALLIGVVVSTDGLASKQAIAAL